MYFNIKKGEIFPVLRNLSRVVGNKTLPVLSNILVDRGEDNLRLTATDTEIQITHEIPLDRVIDVLDTGIFTVPAKKLADIVKALPNDSEIRLFKEFTKNKVEIKSGKSRFTLASLPADDFPVSPQITSDTTFTLPQKELKRLISATHFSMGVTDVRYYLNGTCFDFLSEGRLVAAATDGHRLALASTQIEGAMKEARQVIIPRKTVLELQQLLGDVDDHVEMTIGEKGAIFRFGDTTISTRLIDGVFPDYNEVYPKNIAHKFTFNVNELKAAITQASILSSEKSKGVKFSLSEGLLEITGVNSLNEESSIQCQVQYSGDIFEQGFNFSYVLEMLSAIRTENAIFSTGVSPESSAMFTLEDDESVKYVIMPMRL